jgi:hypothetical protein
MVDTGERGRFSREDCSVRLQAMGDSREGRVPRHYRDERAKPLWEAWGWSCPPHAIPALPM